MSRTDKTRPVWVQVRDPYNRWAMQEEHDHRNGECDFDEWLESNQNYWTYFRVGWGHCHLDYSYYGFNTIKFWPREPRRGARISLHRQARAKWRAERTRLLRGEDFDYSKPRAREYNSWMWECWNW